MTKKEARERKAAWQQALLDGRVVRYNDGMELRSFPTVEAAETFRKAMRAQDVDASIVDYPAVQSAIDQAMKEG